MPYQRHSVIDLPTPGEVLVVFKDTATGVLRNVVVADTELADDLRDQVPGAEAALYAKAEEQIGG